MSDLKIKKAAEKIPFYLLPLKFLAGVARVFFYGARKYAIGNWLTANDTEDIANRYIGGLIRHLSLIQRDDGTYDLKSIGELDEESGLPHIDHTICGLIMLRGLAVKHGAMQADPGMGKDPREATKPWSEAVDAKLAEARVKGGAYDVVAIPVERKSLVSK